MKNTKHTENLDNSTPQEITSQSKRKILTSIGVSSGIIGASAISHQWTKPIVNSIILPAHAHTTDAATHKAEGHEEMDGKYHDDNGMHFTTEPMPDDDDTSDDDTDDGADDGDTSDPMISLSTFPASQLMGDSLGVLMEGDMRTVRVALSVMPTEPVTVTVSGDGVVSDVTPLMFDDKNYMDTQDVMITAGDEPVDMDSEDEAMVTLTASGGNYDKMKRELMYTVGYFGADPVSNVKVMVSDSTDPGMAEVTWDKQETRKEFKEYRVVVAGLAADSEHKVMNVSETGADISDMGMGTAMVTVSVIYEDDTVVPDPDAPAAADKAVI